MLLNLISLSVKGKGKSGKKYSLNICLSSAFCFICVLVYFDDERAHFMTIKIDVFKFTWAVNLNDLILNTFWIIFSNSSNLFQCVNCTQIQIQNKKFHIPSSTVMSVTTIKTILPKNWWNVFLPNSLYRRYGHFRGAVYYCFEAMKAQLSTLMPQNLSRNISKYFCKKLSKFK